MNIGNVYREQGKLDEALKFYQEALAIHKEIGDHLGQADTLYNIGKFFYFSQGKYGDALKRLNEARTIFSQIGATERLHRVERTIAQLESAMR